MKTFLTSARWSPWLEQAWMDRYLDRQLNEDEVAWFEAYALDKPELLAQIDADSTLRDAFAAQGVPGAALSANLAVLAPRQRRRMRLALPTGIAAAAALVAGIGIGVMFAQSARYRVTPGIITNPTRMVFDTLRGSGDSRRMDNPASDSPYVLVEVAVPPDATNISVEVAGLVRRGLAVSPDGFVTLLLSRDVRDTARTGTLNYVWQGERVSKPLDLLQHGRNKNA